MTAKTSSPRFQVGDRVAIHYSDWRGRIVEFRGPLAPGGVFVYRVRIPLKPRPTYIELREDQLIAIPTPPKVDSNSVTSPVSEAPAQREDGLTSPKEKSRSSTRRRTQNVRKEE